MRLKKIIIFLIFTLLITSGFQCTFNPFKKKSAVLKPVTLNVWGVYEESGNLKLLFEKFKKLHPTVSFKYRKFRYNEYEQQLLEAWAEDRGPDIYFLPNNGIGKYKNKITPMPSKVKLPYREIKQSGIGSFQKTDVIDSVKEVRTTSLNSLIQNYPEVVYEDAVKKNNKGEYQIYGLPLSLETMALFYNKEMLNNVNIPFPPSTWTEFKDMVNTITLLDQNNNFIQSGTALGTTDNITNAVDLIILLIRQNGVKLVIENNKISFGGKGNAEEASLTIQAINFYNDFSNPIKEVYSWNENQEDSLEAFINGQVGFFFGYPFHIQQIKARAPKLNFGIAKIPQIASTNNPINFADYWVMTVPHKTKHKDIAWGFIDFAIKKENVKIYLDKTKKPTALKSLINEQMKNLELGPFAEQILTAKSWYRGNSPQACEDYIADMINQIKSGALKLSEIKELLEFTANRINQTIN